MAGDVGFDPLGLSQIKDVGIDLYWLREAELKHCRLAMLAAAGILFVEILGPAPGFPAGKSQMDVFWTVYAEKPSLIGAAIIAISILEVISGIATTQGRQNGDRQVRRLHFALHTGASVGKGQGRECALISSADGRTIRIALPSDPGPTHPPPTQHHKPHVVVGQQPGDYNFDPLNFGKDPAAFKQLQLKEVKNGRLAMIAAAGMILQGVSTHQGALQNLFGGN